MIEFLMQKSKADCSGVLKEVVPKQPSQFHENIKLELSRNGLLSNS